MSNIHDLIKEARLAKGWSHERLAMRRHEKSCALACTAVLMAFTLVGCATKAGSRDMQMTVGQPPEYADGFRDGCDSGYVASGHPYYKAKKDVQRSLDDKLYAMGWNDGFANCKGNYDSIGRALR